MLACIDLRQKAKDLYGEASEVFTNFTTWLDGLEIGTDLEDKILSVPEEFLPIVRSWGAGLMKGEGVEVAGEEAPEGYAYYNGVLLPLLPELSVDGFRYVHNYLRYVVDPGTDVNMSRWPMAAYWEKLLEGVQQIRCWSDPGVDYNEFTLSNFIVNQVGNALDCYLRIFGMDDLIRELGQRSVKMSPKYQRLLAKYEHLKRGIQNE